MATSNKKEQAQKIKIDKQTQKELKLKDARAKTSRNAMASLLGIKDIRDNMVITKNNLTVLLTVSTKDIEILNEVEQISFEDSVIRYNLGLSFPVRYNTITKKFNLTDFKELLEKASHNQNMNEKLLEYQRNLLGKITEIEQNRDVYVRKSYIAISAPNYGDAKRALKELKIRLENIKISLNRNGIRTKQLNNIEIMQYYYDVLNRESNLRIEEALKNGSCTTLYSEGLGLLYAVPKENDDLEANEANESAELKADIEEGFYEIANEEELIREIESIKGKKADFFKEGTCTMFDLIKPECFREFDDYLQLGSGKYVRVFSLANIPRQLNFGFLNQFYSIGNVDTYVLVENIPDRQVIGQITSKFAKIASTISIKEKKGEIINYDEKLAAQDLDNLRMLIQTNSDRMFYSQILIRVWADNLEILKEQSTALQDSCARMGIKALCLVKDQQDAFMNTLMLGENRYKENLRNMTTGSASCLFPIGNTDLNHKEGVYFCNNLITNSPITYDRFINKKGSRELSNPHMYICGKPGSGKSTTMKKFMASSAACGDFNIVLDPEEEYKLMIEGFGMPYITLKSGMKSGINPMEIEVEEENGKKYVDLYAKAQEVRGMISTFVERSRQGEGLKGVEITGLEEAIMALYRNRGITADPDSLYEDDPYGVGKKKKSMPILSDLRNLMLQNKNLEELCELMKLITGEGTLSMFDCQSDPNINITKPLIGINLKHLNDDFSKFFATTNILSWIWGKWSDWKLKTFQKNVWIDEGWLFAKIKSACEYIEQITRRGRKYMLSLIICSQMIEEFLKTQEGQTIIKMCGTKLLLKQDPSSAREIGEFFGLSEMSIENLSGFDSGKGIFMTENDQMMIYVPLYEFEGFTLT